MSDMIHKSICWHFKENQDPVTGIPCTLKWPICVHVSPRFELCKIELVEQKYDHK